jgi:hypothetical protein
MTLLSILGGLVMFQNMPEAFNFSTGVKMEAVGSSKTPGTKQQFRNVLKNYNYKVRNKAFMRSMKEKYSVG